MRPGVGGTRSVAGPIGEGLAEPQPRSLRRKAAEGVAWSTVLTVATKLLQSLSLIPLAWLLSPEDFGLIGLAATIAAFTALVQQMGLREVLIHRQAEFAKLAGPALVIAAVAGVVGVGLILLFIPVAVRYWGVPELPSMLAILAIAAPLHAMALVPEARLYIEMRFRELTGIGLATVAIQVSLTLALAWKGMGAYSWVIPLPIAAAVRGAALWAVTRPQILLGSSRGQWRGLLRDTSTVLATNLCFVAVSHGDYMILAAHFDPEVVGLYFFAFSIAMLPLQVLGTNLTGVLFPALSVLQGEPSRQANVCIRVTGMLALALVPFSLMQAATAGAFVRLLFPSRWEGAIPVLGVLCLGMTLRSVGWPSASLLQAQGRFVTRLWLAFSWAMMFLVLVYWTARTGDLLRVAWAVAAFYFLVGPITLYVAIRPTGGGVLQVFRTFSSATVAAVGATLIAWWVASQWRGPGTDLVRLVATVVIGAALYMGLVRAVAADTWQDLRAQVGSTLFQRKEV